MANFKKIESKWQKAWRKKGIYKAEDEVRGKKNFYHLVMFPYPSGNLHIGHWYNFAPADIFARLKRMQGANVMSPIGFDAFGLPAENAALKQGIHPEKWTLANIKAMTKQLESMGNSYDWSRLIITCLPEYYKWNQWIFVQLMKKGLAYRKKAPANWCPSCKTVLANEQVVEGRCERCSTQIERRTIDQWLFKITHYAEELLRGLEHLDWPERTKLMQKNWIGKSEGALLKFRITELDLPIEVFTTRPDTLFGATYLVLAPEHELIHKLKPRIKNWVAVEEYIRKTSHLTEEDRLKDAAKKTGMELKGVTVKNPANGEILPVWISDYVLASYGTGAIMAVPAHDERDFAFATEFKLPIRQVIVSSQADGLSEELTEAYSGDGYLVNSGKMNGLYTEEAKRVVTEAVGGKLKTQYRLRDWLISRQRYWGTPIPVIYCKECGALPVPENDLPIKLPPLKDFKPSDDGRSPLARNEKFLKTKCPKCGKPAERETDTMDTFVDSSWYFLRYADPNNSEAIFEKEKVKKWLPVKMYIGGAEHAVLHLLYSRFFTKFLRDEGLLEFSEPFQALRHQGIILGPDGQKMSKSRGNVVDPDALVREFGVDAVRLHLAFMSEYSQGGPWNPSGILGSARFLERAVKLCSDALRSRSHRGVEASAGVPGNKTEAKNEINAAVSPRAGDSDKKLERLLHQTIKKVTEDIENLRFNTAVSALMILLNEMEKERTAVSCDMAAIFLKLLAPFAPHFAEELWQKVRKRSKPFASIHAEEWPRYNPALIKENSFELVVQVNGKVRDSFIIPANISEADAKKLTLERESVKIYLSGREPKRVIYVSGRLVNIVI